MTYVCKYTYGRCWWVIAQSFTPAIHHKRIGRIHTVPRTIA